MQKTIKLEMLVDLKRERESCTLVNKEKIKVINKDEAKTYKK